MEKNEKVSVVAAAVNLKPKNSNQLLLKPLCVSPCHGLSRFT